MANYVVVSVYDSAAGAYARPVFVPSRGVAIRSFGDEINREDKDNAMFQHPDDYVLTVLAEWNEDSGVFSVPGEGVGSTLVRGKDCLKG